MAGILRSPHDPRSVLVLLSVRQIRLRFLDSVLRRLINRLMAPNADPWTVTSGPVAIGEGSVHVWRARLDCSPVRLREFEGILQSGELERASRFRFAVHRDRYVSRRGMLRCLLSQHLQIPPADIWLEYTHYGKPFLAKRHGSDLRFNLSHSQDLGLFVLSRGREVGIDLERIQPDFADHAIPERFFTPREAALLRALPTGQQPEAFFELWVRKEAYVKARGLGLSLALDSFDVPFGDSGPAPLLRTAPDPEEAARWTMLALRPAPAYPAALVVEGQASELRCWSWS
jgi:4'-phosphopantetheinyl transferase